MLACPLDCWDSCQMQLDNNSFRATSFSKFLCYKLNNYFKFQKEQNAYWQNQKILLPEALEKLSDILKKTDSKKVLFLKGSGNQSNMQNVTKLFFEKYLATFAVGSTCDGIGEMGIVNARGVSLNLPSFVIKNAKNIILWGRNAYETNIHLLPLINNKIKVCIDVIKTKTAKNSNLFLQIKPESDYFLAILLSRLVIEKNIVKNSNGNHFEQFKRIVFEYNKDDLLKKIGLNIQEVEKLLDVLLDGSVILTGLGVAKCKQCYKTTWAIDSLAMMLDYFGKDDSGVAFLGNSNFNINHPFRVKPTRQIALYDIDLDNFDVVFIQGANPLISLTNQRQWQKLKEKTLIVFGKYKDESAKIATLFIPTKDFFAKDDIRSSYFHEFVLLNRACKDDEGISEYELTKFLFNAFNYQGLKEEESYIQEFLKGLENINDSLYLNPIYKKPPYSDGFYTNDKKFNFLTKKFNFKKRKYHIVTLKEKKALNSQFIKNQKIYINPNSKELADILKDENIEFNKNIPLNIVVAKTGATINKYLKTSGYNAYYTEFIGDE